MEENLLGLYDGVFSRKNYSRRQAKDEHNYKRRLSTRLKQVILNALAAVVISKLEHQYDTKKEEEILRKIRI